MNKIIKDEINKLRHRLNTLKTDTKLELDDTHVAAEILVHLLEEKVVNKEQIHFLKEQSIDFTKVLALIGLQVIPGSSILLIILEKIAKSHGFSILPNPNKTIPNLDTDQS